MWAKKIDINVIVIIICDYTTTNICSNNGKLMLFLLWSYVMSETCADNLAADGRSPEDLVRTTQLVYTLQAGRMVKYICLSSSSNEDGCVRWLNLKSSEHPKTVSASTQFNKLLYISVKPLWQTLGVFTSFIFGSCDIILLSLCNE